ncbi:recombination regulator RecX [Salibacterium halotolerans]|uniref:Regulatory protein RecX n=1 Tax=Salibacterium halotolerans TaxID=1884432 RepID=A0A1I5REY4_9BACI|nr:recombination regulator RecX [Salibacterium halotolerans]SFP57072.1 regulatory protein [Salibacterium halotolerans]
MKIAKLTTQQKRTDRFNVFLEDGGTEEYAFSVDEQVLVAWQLQKGMTLSGQDIEAIKAADQHRKCWNDALHYLAHSMRTEYQVRQHLLQKEYEPDMVESAVSRLKEYRFLQDEEFAMAFVRTKINTSDKGPVVVKEQLYQKGVAEDPAEHALQQFTPEMQLEAAHTFLEKKGKPKKNESASAMKIRLLNALMRKGFFRETAQEAWNRADLEQPEDEQREAVFQQGEKALRKWKDKYDDYTLEMKVKEHLYRKGFPLSFIQEFLEDLRERRQQDEEEVQSDDGAGIMGRDS